MSKKLTIIDFYNRILHYVFFEAPITNDERTLLLTKLHDFIDALNRILNADD